MKIKSNRWIFLLVLFFIIQISANFPDYKLAFEDTHYLADGILQVLATDLNNDQHEEFILAGKNDIGREVFLYWLTVTPDNKPVVQWQSENLFEEHSTIWVTTGKFTTSQNQLLAISNSQYYLYQVENNHVNLIKQEKHNLQILNVCSGDVDGDGQAEIIVAKIGKITAKIYNGIVQVWKFRDGKLILTAESDLIGNIRGITVGNLNQDGGAEIFVEEGPKFAPGNIHILKYSDQKLAEIYCLKKATKGPAYGMQVKAFPDGMRLVTATATGFIDFFRWDKNSLVPAEKEINLERDLMSIAAIDTDNDKQPELLVAGYPQDFLILAKEQKDQPDKNE
jgi:WD40 repeat protein